MIDTTTKREIEALEAEPHQLRCFEYAAEEILEEAAERGVELAGDHDEIYRGMTIMARFHMEQVEGTRPCRCDVANDEW